MGRCRADAQVATDHRRREAAARDGHVARPPAAPRLPICRTLPRPLLLHRLQRRPPCTASCVGSGLWSRLSSPNLRGPLRSTSPVWQVGPLASAPRCACSAAPVSIRRPRSRVPRFGTRLCGSKLGGVAVRVRPHCPAGVVPVPFRQRGKLPRRTRDFGAWLTQTTYGRDIQWLINVKGGGGRNHTQVIGRNHTPVLPLPQCHKDR